MNLITKPNFEDWSAGDWISNSALQAIGGASPDEFNVSLKSVATDDGINDVYETAPEITIAPGTRFLRRGWLYTVDTTANTGVNVMCTLDDGAHTYPGATVAGGQQWGHATASIAAPADAVSILPGFVLHHCDAGDEIHVGPQSCIVDRSGLEDYAHFIWLPSYTPKATHKPRALTAQFGDGYLQRTRDGINTDAAKWALTFSSRDQLEAYLIASFCAASGGVDAFAWTDPLGNDGRFICTDYQHSRTSSQLYQVTATFQEVFDPQ